LGLGKSLPELALAEDVDLRDLEARLDRQENELLREKKRGDRKNQ
jgi:hypothetical protein